MNVLLNTFIFCFTLIILGIEIYLAVRDIYIWLVTSSCSPFHFFVYFVQRHLGYVLGLLWMNPVVRGRAQKFSNDHIPLFLAACSFCFTAYAVMGWLIQGVDRGSMTGYHWYFSALMIWSVMFGAELVLYRNRKLDTFTVLCLSYFGLILASSLYETPHWITNNSEFRRVFIPRYTVSILTMPLILYEVGWRPNRLFWIMLAAAVATWLLWPLQNRSISDGLYWLGRLAWALLFLTLPTGIEQK